MESSTKTYTLFPLRHHDLFDLAKQGVAAFWTADEIDLSSDRADFEALDANERHLLLNILSFFAASDNLVMENINLNFTSINSSEVQYAYAIFNAQEAIHSETYSLLIDTYLTDSAEKDSVFRSLQTNDAVKAKGEWVLRHMHDDLSMADRILAFVLVEGIFFSSSFAVVFWFRSKRILKGLSHSNDLIARDEGLHVKFGTVLFKKYETRPSAARIVQMVESAIAIEDVFIESSIVYPMGSMTVENMKAHVRTVADWILREIGQPPLCGNKATPFDFIAKQQLHEKANFFEAKVTEYKKFQVPEFDTMSDF